MPFNVGSHRLAARRQRRLATPWPIGICTKHATTRMNKDSAKASYTTEGQVTLSYLHEVTNRNSNLDLRPIDILTNSSGNAQPFRNIQVFLRKLRHIGDIIRHVFFR
jgi:hypothetical protein